jgi:hypothetical protein
LFNPIGQSNIPTVRELLAYAELFARVPIFGVGEQADMLLAVFNKWLRFENANPVATKFSVELNRAEHLHVPVERTLKADFARAVVRVGKTLAVDPRVPWPHFLSAMANESN